MSTSPSLIGMYVPPSTAPSGSPGDRWRLSDNLRDWMSAEGYVFDATYGWFSAEACAQRCDVEGEHAWIFTMMRVADMLDAEALRLERDMCDAGAPVLKWSVLREGGGEAAALGAGARREEEVEEGEEGEVEEEEAEAVGGAVDWNEDRVLFDIYAYTPLHALYLFLVDFTQPHCPSGRPGDARLFPADYEVPVVEVLENLAYDAERRRWDLLGAPRRMADMDLGRYRLIPANTLDLNREEYRRRQRALARRSCRW